MISIFKHFPGGMPPDQHASYTGVPASHTSIQKIIGPLSYKF